jgi:C4-dicarboxylate-binding protein DctP
MPFSHIVPENTSKGKMALKFKELIEKRLPGKVSVKIFPNGELYSDSSVLKAMQLGNVEMSAPSLSKFTQFTKQLQVFDLPFLFKDMAAVERFQQSVTGQKLLSSMENKLIVGLGYLHNGMKQLSSNQSIKSPSDVVGKVFRIMNSDVLEAQFESVDAIPLKKPYSETFSLLQSKAVDGQENSWSNIYAKKMFEVQDYITESNHGVLDYLVVTSAEFWYGLPERLRNDIKSALDEAISYGNNIAAIKAEEYRQKIIDSGKTQLISLSNEERQRWIDAMTSVWKMFEQDIGKDLIDAAVKSNQESN